jgi:hypothetical protein
MKSNKKFLSRKWIIIISIILILVVIRLILPRVVLHYANKSLSTLDNYYGHIDDIDLALIRGAYRIDSIYINQIDSVTKEQTPFFSTDIIDLSIEWRSLFKGRIVGMIIFENPVILFTKEKVEPQEVQKDTNDFRQVLDDLMPLKVNRFEIKNGTLAYKDETTKPKVDIKMDRIQLVALNFSSAEDTSLLPATIDATAHVYKGIFTLDMQLDPLADNPTFDLNAELTNTQLTEFNEFFEAYGNLDVNSGTFGLYTEIAAKDQKFTGYVKPVINNLDVVGPEDKNDTFLKQLWEGIAGTVGKILENPEKDQVATKVPIEGQFDDTTIGTWYAIATVLKNAFIQALYPSLDYQINIADVEAQEPDEKKGFLERIFSKDDNKKDDNKKDDDKKKEDSKTEEEKEK